MTKKSARILKAEQVWIDYNALGDNGEHSMAGAEYAKAKIANGTAPLTPEAIDLMAAEIAKRVARREAIEQEYAERQQRMAAQDEMRLAEADARRKEQEHLRHLERIQAMNRPPLVVNEEAFFDGHEWSPEQRAKMADQAKASAEKLVSSLRPDDMVSVGDAKPELAADAFPHLFRQPSPADLVEESLDMHDNAYRTALEPPTTPDAVVERLSTLRAVAQLLKAYYSPFSVDKGPTLLALTGDDIPAPSLILDVLNRIITEA